MSFKPPESGSMLLPDGYVFPDDREYPVRKIVDYTRPTVFDGLTESFCDGFDPTSKLTDIDPVRAIITGVRLHNEGFILTHGAMVGQEQRNRTVASVIDLDFDYSNERITDALNSGAIIGPYLLISEAFFSHGVGLWEQRK